MSYTTSPLVTSNTGKWTATSTYDVYMVDTPQGDGDNPMKDESKKYSSRPKRTRKQSKRRGRESNADNGNNAMGNLKPRAPRWSKMAKPPPSFIVLQTTKPESETVRRTQMASGAMRLTTTTRWRKTIALGPMT